MTKQDADVLSSQDDYCPRVLAGNLTTGTRVVMKPVVMTTGTRVVIKLERATLPSVYACSGCALAIWGSYWHLGILYYKLYTLSDHIVWPLLITYY